MAIKLNIQAKYICFISGIIIFTSVFLCVFLLNEQAKIHSKNLEKKAIDLVRNFSFNAAFTAHNQTTEVTVGDSVFDKLIAGVLKEDNVVYCGILSNDIPKKWIHYQTIPEFQNNHLLPTYLTRVLNEDEFSRSDIFSVTYPLPKGLLPSEYTNHSNYSLLVVITPIYSSSNADKRIIAYAVIGISLAQVQETILNSLKVTLFMTAVVIILGILISILLTNTIINPIKKLLLATEKIAGGDYSYKFDIQVKDEIGQLAQSFNYMIEQIRSVQNQLSESNFSLEQNVLERTHELSIALEKAKESDRLKSEFMTNISHELRTPLNTIIGFSDVLLQGLDGDINSSQSKDLALINYAGRHLLTLIDGLLSIAKIESGEMSLVYEAVDLKLLTEQALYLTKGLLKDKKIELQLGIADDVPSVIQADKTKLKQILLHLLSNAAKFTNEGFIKIIVQRKDGDVLFEIHDTGIGIQPENVDKVFKRFSQVDGSTSRTYGGLGIGMSIVKDFVNLHKGKIWIESVYQKGSVFFFTIPIDRG